MPVPHNKTALTDGAWLPLTMVNAAPLPAMQSSYSASGLLVSLLAGWSHPVVRELDEQVFITITHPR